MLERDGNMKFEKNIEKLEAFRLKIEKLKNKENTVSSGYATIIIIITIFSVTILIAVRLLGKYLGRIFVHLNNKPQFIIRKSWSNKEKSSNC